MDDSAGDATAGRPAAENPRAGGFGSLGSIVGLLVVGWVVTIAAGPLKDNSFFTHLATGRLILERGSVPSSDPYTFTARGADWTVQSWLASVVYAAAERLAGGAGLRFVVLVLFVVAGALVWRLSRPADAILVRIGIVALALFAATDVWSERPYMVGVIGLAVVWLALDGAIRPWLLVPLLWVWANSHGSFPLATVLVVAVLAGTWLDDRRGRPSGDAAVERRVLGFTVLGTLLAAVGPLGLEVLTFPLSAVTKSDVLAEMREWQAPLFQSNAERAFLLLALLAIAGLVRDGRWRLAVPTLLFTAAAVTAQRNVAMAVVVLVPALACCAPTVGTLRSRTSPSLGPLFAGVLAVLVTVMAVSTLGRDVTSFSAYPQYALAWSEDRLPADARMASQDYVGNLLEVLDGEEADAFIDDRADMFPEGVFADSTTLLDGEPDWSAVLDDHEIDVVVWRRDEVLASLLAVDERWRIVFSDTRWAVACRRDGSCDRLTR